jgi:hypothetical protein
LADKDITFALVKFITTLRSEKTWPEDPTSYMIDYFGNERSALWEDMEEM